MPPRPKRDLATPIPDQVPSPHRAGLDAVAGCVRVVRCGGLETGHVG